MAGADFVRADLHVHSFADTDLAPAPDLDAYLDAAVAAGIAVMAITDHNTARFARAATDAVKTRPLLLLPGIEISTQDGHLLGIFAPTAIDALEELALPQQLKLTDVSATEKRSMRSMLDLVGDIDARGGLAIPAHVDADNGMADRLDPGKLRELLASPALAGLEFAKHETLKTWFTDTDSNEQRRLAWFERQRNPELRERGLARLMSSDAHSPQRVGQDRTSRTLTRLRLDDVNFEAVRNGVVFNPKARCKAEVTLPASYPRIERAEFKGGFLDGVALDLSHNLSCLIGGRGSGKSTALLAIRAALGAEMPEDDDADAEDRMPDETRVTFVDKAGSMRTAIRRRGECPVDLSGAPVRLRIADLGQDESGRLARAYEAAPSDLLEFLDGFIERHEHDELEEELSGQVADNGAEILRTNNHKKRIAELEADEKRLQASLDAAGTGRIEELAQWVVLLNSQEPLLAKLDALLREVTIFSAGPHIDLDRLARVYGVPLDHPRIAPFVEGATGLRRQLADVGSARSGAEASAGAQTAKAAEPARATLANWQADQRDLQQRMEKKRAELAEQGLKVEAGALENIAKRLTAVKDSLVTERQKASRYKDARSERKRLVSDLRGNRDRLYQRRRATLRQIAQQANPHGEDLTIRVSFEREGMRGEWSRWLAQRLNLRSPRVDRLAAKITPGEFADAVLTDRAQLKLLTDDDSERFIDDATAHGTFTWEEVFALQTMRLPDRPRVQVQEPGAGELKSLDGLSAGQQRSVLLSLILCAERADPLVLDQPEDHLDAQYIAKSVVRHLEGAKERRQVILATHSPNLTVLGDAELVIPMRVVDGRGQPHAEGAVDRPETRDRVCALLEGGVEAFRKRGERYGLIVKPAAGGT
jgi:ABC-type Mn2+/Zn2+ transport system ATPase subunit